MKRIIHSIVIVTAILVSGCKGFLDEKNYSNTPADELYATAAGYQQLVTACYGKLRTIYSELPYLFNSGTDIYVEAYNDGARTSNLGQYRLLTPSDGNVYTFYSVCYEGIGLCNTALYYADKTETTGILDRQISEVRFLRAFWYFHLVQQFGGVALVREMATEPILAFPRDSESDVYSFIITELLDVISDLNERSVGETYGRVDKRTARFFLAKAYLTRGWITNDSNDFTQAKSYADQAIDGVGLTTDFGSVYSPANRAYRNEEVIWSVIYSENSLSDPGKGNIQSAIYGSEYGGVNVYGHKPSSRDFLVGLWGHYLFAKNISDPNNDTRYEATFMPTLYEFYNLFYTRTPGELSNTKIQRYYPPWWYDFDETNWRAENTAQRENTMIYPISAPPDPDIDLAGFQIACGNSDGGYCSNTGISFTKVPFRKYDCLDANNVVKKGGTRDVDIARLSDAYLIAAEASIKLNRPGDAVPYINEIRKRAIKASDAQREIGTAQATVDFVLEERARELMGQYDRWYDLKRTGRLIDWAVKYNPDLDKNREYFRGPDGNDKILRPIPQRVIDQNRAQITQNPGYVAEN